MICQWQAYLNLIPTRMRKEVDEHGRASLQELRLRVGQAPQLVLQNRSMVLRTETTEDDLKYVINGASQYSPWAAATMSEGYLTGPGGHRIGICGQAIRQTGKVTGIKDPVSLCVRTARDFPGIAGSLRKLQGSVLIIGPPGSGKTTLLRDLIRQRAALGNGSVAVVDERGELFPFLNGRSAYPVELNTDIMSGTGKEEGIEMVLRTMGPACIAVDEISSERDCIALLKAGWSGVSLLATAHAGNLDELKKRPVYRPVLDMKLFDHIVCLKRDKSWHLERIGIWDSN